MTSLTVAAGVVEAFGDLRIVAITATGLDNDTPWPDVSAGLDDLERAVADGAGAVDQYAPTGSDDLDEFCIRTIITQTLIAAKIDAAKLYAFLTIGCLVTVDNASHLTATQVTEWIKAVRDYRQRHSGHV